MTRRAKVLFPSRDGELMGRLVRFLKERGAEDLVQTFFESYWDDRTEAVKQKLERVASDDLDDKVDTLHEILEEEGFMPDITRDDKKVTIRECNCPFPESVKETRIPCRLEEEFYKEIFQAGLERVSYIPEGSPACSYVVTGP
jgi:predicted ArsR family transcriptional regulator